jgi:hypothetical protein
MKTSLHPEMTLTLVRSRIRLWSNSTGHQNPKGFIRSLGGLQAMGQGVLASAASNCYLFW